MLRVINTQRRVRRRIAQSADHVARRLDVVALFGAEAQLHDKSRRALDRIGIAGRTGGIMKRSGRPPRIDYAFQVNSTGDPDSAVAVNVKPSLEDRRYRSP